MSGKSGSSDDVVWRMKKKTQNSLTNLLWREPLREQMKCDEKCSLCAPISEVERNLVGVENLLLACILGCECSRDGGRDGCGQPRGIKCGRSLAGQLPKDGLDLFANRWAGICHARSVA